MKLLDDQTDLASLFAFGAEAVLLIKAANYQKLADRFGYALAFGKEPSEVIEREIVTCLIAEGRHATIDQSAAAKISVKYFEPNNSSLFALVECFLPLVQDSGEILIELIVTSKGPDRHVCVEQISYAA
jgi:hypothetical protein